MTEIQQVSGGLVEAFDDALVLLEGYSQAGEYEPLLVEPLLSLLEQCEQLCAEIAPADGEPIRTVHHFACTGGSLITKCMAAMPNTQVLSEVDPLSAQTAARNERFFPTDLVRLARASTRGATDEVVIDIFLRGVAALYHDASRQGLRLILRDHAHSHFCMGSDVAARSSLRDIISERFACRSVVTVRNPVDSYLSLLSKGWCHFEPATIDEYCRRYIAFLDFYNDVDIFRYEDFVNQPSSTLEKICNALAIPFNEEFVHVFSIYQISGDSGRSGSIIGPRPRRKVPEAVKVEIKASGLLRQLHDRLGYRHETEASFWPG